MMGTIIISVVISVILNLIITLNFVNVLYKMLSDHGNEQDKILNNMLAIVEKLREEMK